MTKRQHVKLLAMPVVADGGLAHQGTGGGRLIPVVMVDMRGNPEVSELVRLHGPLGQGDCHSQWGQADTDQIFLRLRFERPVEMTIGLLFRLPQQAGLIDQMLTARSVYLQHGVTGDRMSTAGGNPRILIELPPTGFETTWEKLFPAALARNFRQSGMKRVEAKRSAVEMVARWREFGSIRLG